MTPTQRFDLFLELIDQPNSQEVSSASGSEFLSMAGQGIYNLAAFTLNTRGGSQFVPPINIESNKATAAINLAYKRDVFGETDNEGFFYYPLRMGYITQLLVHRLERGSCSERERRENMTVVEFKEDRSFGNNLSYEAPTWVQEGQSALGWYNVYYRQAVSTNGAIEGADILPSRKYEYRLLYLERYPGIVVRARPWETGGAPADVDDGIPPDLHSAQAMWAAQLFHMARNDSSKYQMYLQQVSSGRV